MLSQLLNKLLILDTGTMHITGKVTHINLSGGFWGIEGDDGKQYQPTKPLPNHLQKEGLRIRAKAKANMGFSVFMWGQQVDLTDIQTL